MARILIAEDYDLLRESLALALQEAGHDTTVVSNGLEALVTFQNNSEFDLVISDNMMPEMSGTELLKQLRQGIAPAVPFILYTGNPTPDAQHICAKFGGNFLVKSAEDIIAVVDKVLGKS